MRLQSTERPWVLLGCVRNQGPWCPLCNLKVSPLPCRHDRVLGAHRPQIAQRCLCQGPSIHVERLATLLHGKTARAQLHNLLHHRKRKHNRRHAVAIPCHQGNRKHRGTWRDPKPVWMLLPRASLLSQVIRRRAWPTAPRANCGSRRKQRIPPPHQLPQDLQTFQRHTKRVTSRAKLLGVPTKRFGPVVHPLNQPCGLHTVSWGWIIPRQKIPKNFSSHQIKSGKSPRYRKVREGQKSGCSPGSNRENSQKPHWQTVTKMHLKRVIFWP